MQGYGLAHTFNMRWVKVLNSYPQLCSLQPPIS